MMAARGKSGTKKEGRYTISVVAERFGVHAQTLRLYEREGLLAPSRTRGNTRLYTEDDMAQLAVILSLTRDLGVNLAGVEIILNMRKKMEAMQRQIREFVQFVNTSMTTPDVTEDPLTNAIIPLRASLRVDPTGRKDSAPEPASEDSEIVDL